MPIEINGNGPPPSLLKNAGEGAATQQKQTPASSSAPAGDKPAAAPSDSVSFTEASARLHDLEKVLDRLPAEDAARVQEIRKALADGSYRVDPERVADKLLQFEHMLKNTV